MYLFAPYNPHPPPPQRMVKKNPLNAFIVMVTLNFEANSYYNACNEEPIGRKT